MTEVKEASEEVVLRLDLTVDEQSLYNDVAKVLEVIRPQWPCDEISYKLFTDGITNKLIGCSLRTAGVSNNNKPSNGVTTTTTAVSREHGEDVEAQERDVVLVRVYGNKTDLLIDRAAETKNIQLLHRHGYAPALYATFRNGLAYEYVPGVTLTPVSCRDGRIWPLVAVRMAQMHKVSDASKGCTTKRVPMLAGKIEQFLRLLPEKFSDPVKDARIAQIFPSVAELREDFSKLYAKLSQLNSPVVFCHNDLLLGNVIYNETQRSVTFIDYEYADYNHQAYDIGNHFTEFAGIDEIDYARYPTKDFQLAWLRVYLEEFHGVPEGTTIPTIEIERLYVQVNQFALASHFLWAVWALIQAEHSTIEFDFIKFGETRYREYLRRRAEFLSLSFTN